MCRKDIHLEYGYCPWCGRPGVSEEIKQFCQNLSHPEVETTGRSCVYVSQDSEEEYINADEPEPGRFRRWGNGMSLGLPCLRCHYEDDQDDWEDKFDQIIEIWGVDEYSQFANFEIDLDVGWQARPYDLQQYRQKVPSQAIHPSDKDYNDHPVGVNRVYFHGPLTRHHHRELLETQEMNQTSQARVQLTGLWPPNVYNPDIAFNQPYFEENPTLTVAERTQLAIPSDPPSWPESPRPQEDEDEEYEEENEEMEDESDDGMEWSQTFFKGVDDLEPLLRNDGPSNWQDDQ
jgi:hypothetical protein